MAVECVVYYNKHDSVSRLISGFLKMAECNLIRLRLVENIGNFRKTPDISIVEVEIQGKLIAFDMGDRWALCAKPGEDYLERVDGYFARDYSEKVDIVTPVIFPDNKKVQPFGFNYYTTCKNNPIDQTSSLRSNLQKCVKAISGYSRCTYPEYFEGTADWKDKDISIIFMARLWDTRDIKLSADMSKDAYDYCSYMLHERERINKCRIEIMRQLKKEYGSAFTGGIYQDSFSEKECPDLILPKSIVRKKPYIDRMKKTDICIGSMGLHRSIGWKIGEYVAAARAIVSERFEYVVPGNFDDGHHYIPYDTTDECLEAVASLYTNPSMLYEMKKANELYYLQYLKIEQQILNAFHTMNIDI